MDVDRQEIADLFAEVSLGAPEAAVGFVLWRVMHRYQRAVDRALEPTDLTHLQFTTLAIAAWLAREAAPTQAEIARGAEMHPMQVSLVLKPLEAKGMLRRQASARRANAKEVRLTRAGMDALRTALPQVIAVQRRMFGHEAAGGGALLGLLLDVETRDAGLPPRD